MNDAIWNKYTEYDTEDYEFDKLIKYLNSSNFRSFKEGLISFIQPRAKEGEVPIDCLKRCCIENDVDIYKDLATRNTIKDWFSGVRSPQKGEDSRRKMFVLAFALSLNTDETADLIQKVFLDRAFNPRNYKELIYYYCIERGLSLKQADNIISKINIQTASPTDKTVYTQEIATVINQVQDDDKLIEYINTHPHNFSISNKSAKEAVDKYIRKAKEYIKKEIVSPAFDEIKSGKTTDSINFMYEVIISQPTTNEKGTKTIFGNAELPKEIKVNFPEATTFSKKEPTYDELRKMLVLLFSYCFWYNVQYQNTTEYDIDDYITQINDLLYQVGLAPIYPGNPFDWMFCFCTLQEMPLDTFRAIIADALDGEGFENFED